ncbi:MAG: aminotransferase class I/II-fold pyridoxal phosphate-dependent enzyme, partial [Pseudomonadales bacterium]|nr:aminotransferase class I/II-fold pyridoxal phosphate-dependent enzyme [Pseudomonadales bacterium]
MSYERSGIKDMNGYASGEQPTRPDVIKLNTNENPYPAGPSVKAALQACRVEDLRRYPPPLATDFRAVAARLHGLEPDNIIATNGGDELLRLAITTFVNPGEAIGIAEPSYSLYPVLAAIQGCPLVRIPLLNDWSLPVDYAQQLNAAGAKLAFIVNPHAPSGTLTPVSVLARLATEFSGVLLIDEAYVDFVDPDCHYDAVALVKTLDNVLILRTMSKGYSLAGLRFAYGLGAKSLLHPMLYKTRDSYNTDFLSQTLATAALSAQAEAAISWEKVRLERSRVRDALTALGFRCAPSQSNFLLAEITQTEPGSKAEKLAASLYERLKAAGILIRYFNQPGLRDKLRISIGTAQ